jgi:hypothetical protein
MEETMAAGMGTLDLQDFEITLRWMGRLDVSATVRCVRDADGVGYWRVIINGDEVYANLDQATAISTAAAMLQSSRTPGA